MNLYDTSRRYVLPGMGWNGGAFYYSDVYKKPWNIMFGTEYFPVGEQAAKTFVPQKDMELVQKTTPELMERIAEMVSQQLDDLLAWFDRIKCWQDLEQWGKTKYGKRPWYDKLKKAFQTIAEHW